jgi:hypothetical protein
LLSHRYALRPSLRVAALSMVLLLSRLPLVVLARQRRYFNVDELDLTLDGIDRFLDVPHANLQWPGTINHLFIVPLAGITYVAHAWPQINANSFVDYLSHVYRDPWNFLFLARLMVATIAACGLAMLLPNLAKRIGSEAVAAGGLILITTVPALMITTSGAWGTGAGLGLAGLAIAVAISPGTLDESKPYGLMTAGILSGFALAGRTILLPIVLFIAGLLAERTKRRWRTTVLFLAIVALAFVFACPQTWVAPILWAKANLGNYHKPGKPIGLVRAIELIENILPFWLMLAALAGFVRLAWRRNWTIVVASVVACLSVIIPCSHAPTVFSRYYIGLTVIAGMLALLGLGPLIASMLEASSAGFSFAMRSGLMLIVGALLLTSNIVGTEREFQRSQTSRNDVFFANSQEVRQFRSAVRSFSGRKILIPLELFPWVSDLASAPSLTRAATAAQNAVGQPDAIVKFVSSRGVPAAAAAALISNFNPKQQAWLARVRVMAAGDDFGLADITFFGESSSTCGFGVMSAQNAATAFNSGRFSAIVALGPMSVLGVERKINPKVAIIVAPGLN